MYVRGANVQFRSSHPIIKQLWLYHKNPFTAIQGKYTEITFHTIIIKPRHHPHCATQVHQRKPQRKRHCPLTPDHKNPHPETNCQIQQNLSSAHLSQLQSNIVQVQGQNIVQAQGQNIVQAQGQNIVQVQGQTGIVATNPLAVLQFKGVRVSFIFSCIFLSWFRYLDCTESIISSCSFAESYSILAFSSKFISARNVTGRITPIAQRLYFENRTVASFLQRLKTEITKVVNELCGIQNAAGRLGGGQLRQLNLPWTVAQSGAC